MYGEVDWLQPHHTFLCKFWHFQSAVSSQIFNGFLVIFDGGNGFPLPA